MTIFVFGSNLAGIHGAGAARTAHREWGAQWGIGVGVSGRSFAIPTRDHKIQTLSLYRIELFVRTFLNYAELHRDDLFLVTAIGCGRAGYKPEQIAPLFEHAPDNCLLSERFRPFLPARKEWLDESTTQSKEPQSV